MHVCGLQLLLSLLLVGHATIMVRVYTFGYVILPVTYAHCHALAITISTCVVNILHAWLKEYFAHAYYIYEC